ncbi:dehydrogenase/reductase SDR family member 12-like isoform X2 [Branchiostoma floridae]|uniref:Dehydrogenase/reductase SDR family member 12-like isoform X2 n=1 Tax=Branchiostoma floridae TaxID=7739 RepID=A0A9J7N8V3_BRAFL|nr:dehydrogenase/reductase SDR family member 12-like isoform X2 [Branchiostoma floridae]
MSLWRNAVWFIKGMREYTNSGYAAAAKTFDPCDLQVDVTGRTFLITGANSGIGKATAEEVAKRGGTVHLVCRNPTRGEEALKDIMEKTGSQVNNAGCMINTREVSADGLEGNFATNTLGTYILTTGLLPLLSQSEQPRVITVSSGGMLPSKLNIKDLQFEQMRPFDGTMAYSQNKRQQVVMTEQWAQQYPTIHFSSCHPGWADTPAVRTSMPDFHQKMKSRLRSVEQGADTLVWLSVAEAVAKQPGGLFFQDRAPVSKHLPLAWTKSTKQEEAGLMQQLEEIAGRFKS